MSGACAEGPAAAAAIPGGAGAKAAALSLASGSAAPTAQGVAIPFAVACAGIASFTAMDVFMKGLSIAIGAYNAIFWRAVAGIAISGALYWRFRLRQATRSEIRPHLARGALTSVMALLWFWGLARVPIAEAIALTFIAPIMAIFLAGLMLGERIRPTALVGSMLGLAGVMVMLAPRLGAGFGDGALAGACSILGFALLYALNLVLIRKQAQSVSPIELAFFQNLINLFFLSLAAPFFASFPSVAQLPAILASAALALVSLMLLSWAYARAQAQSLVSVEYTGFGWGALYGWLVFGEAVGPWLLAGTLLIVAGCILAARSPRGPQEITAEGTL